MLDRYFDNAATTPVDPRVIEEMIPFFHMCPGNADSNHSFGQQAHAAIDLARTRVAELINAGDPSQITFTSGASESNNWVISNFKKLAISKWEHSSVSEAALKHQSDCEFFTELGQINSNPDLVALMSINNEVGTIFEADAQYRTLKDATQAVGKIPIDANKATYLSASAHKFYGPKGVGFLYQEEMLPSNLIKGGGQENGQRGSTLNVPGIVGLGVAAAIAEQEMSANFEHVQNLNRALLEEIDSISDWKINGGQVRSPYILSLSFLGIEGESVLIELDNNGFACSSGAACSSKNTEPSYVLQALNLEPEWLRGTIRISFGKYNTLESTAELGKSLVGIVEKLRNLGKMKP